MSIRYRYLWLSANMFLFAGCDVNQQTEPRSLSDILNLNSGHVERNFDPAQIQRGSDLFHTHCAGCHGENAVGTVDWRTPNPDGRFPPPPLNGTAHDWHHSTAVLKKTILKGGPPEISAMPAWEGILTEQQVDDIVVWIKSLWSDEIYAMWYNNFEDK
jgi:mono/diheme cytochrome c family protein